MNSHLFSPLTLRDLTLENRLVVSPMCMYSAEDGNATDWHLIHLGGLALSGAGLMMLEATGVEPEGRITAECLGLWSDENEAALARVLHAVRQYSSIPIAIQLAHAGRKASSRAPWDGGQLRTVNEGGWQPVAPSAIPHLDSEAAPAELDLAGIERIREAFVESALRAARLGIDAVELHCAHGYLMHQFLSPLSNRRTDQYGGSLENRLRLPLEIFDDVRAIWPADRPLGVRISATDWVEGGWEIEQSVIFARELKRRGCDWIDTSTGGLSQHQKIPVGPGFQVEFAERIRAETGIPPMAVGLITDPAQAESIIATGQADMVAMARGLLWNTHWPWQAAAELGAQVKAPPQYWRAIPYPYKGVFEGAKGGGR